MKLRNDIFFAEVERMLSEGEEVAIVVRGYSMTPLLRNGKDKAILRRVQPSDIRVGQVVLFRYRGAHVLHRIERIEGDSVIFAGDGNYKIKEQATKADIVATMIAVERPSGRRIACSSGRWRFWSGVWLMLPAFVRRVILGVRRRVIKE